MSSRSLLLGLRCCSLLLLTGCSAFSPASLLGPKVEFADAGNPAREIICMWEPAEGKDPQGKPSRGFNGTILFFDRTHTTPIGARGTLTFYVYDDYGPRESWAEPIAEYKFTPQQWDRFFAIGPLGPSYRIFIPYPRQHPYQVNTTLWVKFEPADGTAGFYSKRSPIVLPGPLVEDDRIQIHETTDIRGYAPEKMQGIVAASFSEDAETGPRDPRIHTIHRWDPSQPETVMETSHIELANHEVTQGAPAGAHAGFSKSAPGAAAESWGSTPPALSFDSKSSDEPPRSHKRFKLTAPK